MVIIKFKTIINRKRQIKQKETNKIRMTKKIEDKSILGLKKTIKRQNTMEATAEEGVEFVKRLQEISKKKGEQKKILLKNMDKTPIISTPAIKKSSPSKQIKKTKVPLKSAKFSMVYVPKKVKLPIIPTVSAAPLKSKSSECVKNISKNNSASVIEVEPKDIPSSLLDDVNSCSKIAKTQVIKNGNLGYQIIKKSLKGQTDGSDKPKKPVLLRTKTGEKMSAGMIDVVFCCDTTGSMSSFLVQCKSTVKQIMKRILDKTQEENISVKFGFVAYRDHPDQDGSYLTNSYDLTNEAEIGEFISSLSASGGGDLPEAVMDGLYVSSKHMAWRDSTHIPSLRYIFHIADAPPHGSEYGYSQQQCKCKIDINQIAHIINMKQIHYRFINASNLSTKKMAEIFKQKIVDYEECPIEKAAEMDVKISDMIIRELFPDMVEENL